MGREGVKSEREGQGEKRERGTERTGEGSSDV